MRILFLTNFYPPARPGGYTQWCHEVAENLKIRGHSIGVLTSDHESHKVTFGESNIFRCLHLDGDLVYYQPWHFFAHRRKQYRGNLVILEQVVEEFAPDLIFVWGMWAMSKALPALAERLMPSRVVYYLSDYWPASLDMHTVYWKSPANKWVMRLPKRFLSSVALWILAKEGKPDLKFEHAICVSKAVKNILVGAGLPLRNARVIHGGTDLCRFSNIRYRDFSKNPLKLLYAGQLVHHKGVHTAIDAVSKLLNDYRVDQFQLTLVGSGHPDYITHLRSLVAREDLNNYVNFKDIVPKDEMPSIFNGSHVLILPSIYEEPFARITQEAMLSGLVVVGTTTGGTGEILAEGKTGLTFKKENSEELASQLLRLLNDRDLCDRLAKTGRQTVLDNFTLEKMVDRIEDCLQRIVIQPAEEFV